MVGVPSTHLWESASERMEADTSRENKGGGGGRLSPICRFAVFGDMGNVNARSLGKLQKEAQQGDFTMVLHVGSLQFLGISAAIIGME